MNQNKKWTKNKYKVANSTEGLMNQFLKDHQLNKAEFGVTDGSISVWISGSQDKNPSIFKDCYLFPQSLTVLHLGISG